MFDAREVKFLSELKPIIMKNVNQFDLYQQKELVDLIGISGMSFRKYFSSDEEWNEKSMMIYGKRKFFKGYQIRLKIIDLVYESWSFDFEEDKKKIEKIMAPYENRVGIEFITNEDYEYDNEASNIYAFFGDFNKKNESKYWAEKLNEKIKQTNI